MTDGKQNLILTTCPIKEYSEYYISACTQQDGFYLKVLKFDASRDETQGLFEEIAITQVSNQVTSLGWTRFGNETEKNYMGLLMTGHNDGKLSLWSIVDLIENSESKSIDSGLIKTFKGIHSSKVTCIEYNIKPNVAATASTELMIVQILEDKVNGGYDLTVAMQCTNDYDTQEISSIAWNDKVSYIISVASKSGIVYVWDMKKNKIHLRIRDQSMQEERTNLCTNAVWASDGVQIIIAYDDQDYPFLTQYHMSQTNAPFAEYHGGHNKAIYKMVKNPNDPNFLLSVGRDNSVTCWSIRTQRNIFFKQFNEKILQILWAPHLNDVALVVTESLNIEDFQVCFDSDPAIYDDEVEELPRWMLKKSHSEFTWDGKLLSYFETRPQIALNMLSNNFKYEQMIKDFISKLEQQDIPNLLNDKISSLESSLLKSQQPDLNEKNKILMWVTLKCINQKDFSELFRYFGFDKEKLLEEAGSNIGKIKKDNKRVLLKDLKKEKTNNAQTFWEEIEAKPETQKDRGASCKDLEKEKPMTVKEEFNRNINWNQLGEKHIKSCLLFGELELAMENAFNADRDAEALLIASNDPELFVKAKARYFSKSKDLYIKNVFSSIVNKNFGQLLEHNMKEWKEYLLYGLTYLDQNEFRQFSLTLGDKLAISGDLYSSIVCDLLGGDGLKAIEKLYSNYKIELSKVPKENQDERSTLLINLFEKIIVIHNILQISIQNNSSLQIIKDYSNLLVKNRLYVEAFTYLCKIKNPDLETQLLMDRVYGLNDDNLNKTFKKPYCPFKDVHIKPHIKQNPNNANTNVKLQQKGNFNKAPEVLNKPNIFNNQIGGQNPNNSRSDFNNNNIVSNQNNFNQGSVENNPNIVSQVKTTRQVIKPPIVKPPILSQQNNVVQEVNNDFNPTKQNISYSNTQNVTGYVPKVPIIQQTVSTKINPNVNSQINQPVNTQSHNINAPTSDTQTTQLDEDDNTIINAFDRYMTLYNGVYTDSTRQKDFSTKVSSLMSKLKNGELKLNLKKLLVQFIGGKNF